ncbi:5-methyltetrahydropteroyltriglutamate--homocysteine S-methyltransferase [Macrococcoides caseolyticum]|uniref:5-methyltetrahydropteroyltriglutamate-- homocysteine S-methyltransferase n=1 Tax=Macrococcoides caseolyticum TaxID=69966 RepID=UPI001F3D576B|nr:5-methyltetrahydropteroyltriglutamate--homocysteine S-methyltransferase [Macrococcus caseolyticus]MCE4956424.1 5-methyltetrahydropteroyltriglutamate--homocysteine S-methyltransferase [Macrococcus caseolyticus]
MTNSIQQPKYDYVGSFLRPARLKEARERFKNNEITQDALTQVENEEIIKLINKLDELGYQTVTDGEFRRSYWHLDFFFGFNGIEQQLLDQGYQFNKIETRSDSVKFVDKINGQNHPFVDHFKFVRDNAPRHLTVKQTIPAPAQLLVELTRPGVKETVDAVYPDKQELYDDIVATYKQVIDDLHKEGLKVLQLDDCSWGIHISDDIRKKIHGEGNEIEISSEALIQQILDINNRVIANAPDDLIINTHVCRGNYKSDYASSGPYTKVADALFGKENVDGYYLEYDTERAGGFEPLQHVSGEKKVVLGLITSKFPELEDKENIKARIKEAAQFISLERLSLSPQCGFASTEEGNILTEEDQWKKLQLIKEIAEEVFSDVEVDRTVESV